MRIAQVVASYQPRIGGVEIHVRRIAEGCAEAGDDVTVLTHQIDDLPPDECVDSVRVLRFPLTVKSANYPLSLSLSRYLKAHTADFDLIHVHSYHTLVGHAARGCRLPLVFTPHYHGTGHTPLRAFLHQLYRPVGGRLFEDADAIICMSVPERELMIKDFPSVAKKAITIPSGTDPKSPDPDPGLAQPTLNEPMVLTVGRLERYKNIDLTIDAFRALPSSAVLVVVGDGPDRTRLERRAEAGGPGWPVLFTGRIPDPMLDGYFAQANVVTSASDHEAFGTALAEGLRSGARVVASAIPAHAALAQLAGADAAVALVDPRDTKRFTEVLAKSLLAGRVSPEDLKLPSWEEVVADTREVYARVRLEGRPADEGDP